MLSAHARDVQRQSRDETHDRMGDVGHCRRDGASRTAGLLDLPSPPITRLTDVDRATLVLYLFRRRCRSPFRSHSRRQSCVGGQAGPSHAVRAARFW